ncbi:hypothetical protein EDF66_104212 [Sphingobacterium sp. JUb20]|nr:hypothetical protein EDF66_104212 [Sphingobacterium sp. JUb20]
MWAIPMFFKIQNLRYPIMIFSFMLLGCEKETKITLTDQTKIAVNGLLIVNGKSILHLSRTGNLNQQTKPQAIQQASVSLKNESKTIVYQHEQNGYWVNDKMALEYGMNYTLNISVASEKIQAKVQVPFSYNTQITRKNTKTSDMTLTIKSPKPQCFILKMMLRNYTIGANKERIYSDDWQEATIATKSMQTDNVKYRELQIPYSKLFIPKTSEASIDFQISADNNNTEYKGIVQAVDPTFYQYYYNYTNIKQGNSEEEVLTNKGNITGGVGILGTAVERIVYID